MERRRYIVVLLLLLRDLKRRRAGSSFVLNAIRVLFLFMWRALVLPALTSLRPEPVSDLPAPPAPDHVLAVEDFHSSEHTKTLFDAGELVDSEPDVVG